MAHLKSLKAYHLYKMICENSRWKRNYIIFSPSIDVSGEIPQQLPCLFFIDLDGEYFQGSFIGTIDGYFIRKFSINDMIELGNFLKYSKRFGYNKKLKCVYEKLTD